MNKTNNQVSVNTLQAQNFFNSHNKDLLNALNKAQLYYKIAHLENTTDNLHLKVELEQPHSTTATNYLEHFTLQIILHNSPRNTHSLYTIRLDYNKGAKQYPHTTEERKAWEEQNILKEYNFFITNYELKRGYAYLRNETTDNTLLHTWEAIAKLIELAKQLATAKE
jgi:hypothetical protein